MRQWIFPLSSSGDSTKCTNTFNREVSRLLADDEDTSDIMENVPLEEKFGQHGQRRTQARRRWTRLLWIVQYLVMTLIIITNGLLLVFIWAGRVQVIWVAGKALPPEMSISTPKVFTEEAAFNLHSEDRGAAAWTALTANMDIGKVYVSNPESHSLFHSELRSDIPGYDLYPIAMYHQIHCLGTIREVFYTLNISEAVAYGQHVGHCFDYLRLSLLCSADLTLEYTTVGMEVEHLCKDPKEVDAFMNAYNTEIRASYAATSSSIL